MPVETWHKTHKSETTKLKETEDGTTDREIEAEKNSPKMDRSNVNSRRGSGSKRYEKFEKEVLTETSVSNTSLDDKDIQNLLEETLAYGENETPGA